MPIRVLLVLLVLTTATCVAATCEGFDQLRLTLNMNNGGLADSLRDCVAPLLFAPDKWLPTDQATDFCSQDACVRAVKQLQKLPKCTWDSQVPAGSDANTLAIAQQVMNDCA